MDESGDKTSGDTVETRRETLQRVLLEILGDLGGGLLVAIVSIISSAAVALGFWPKAQERWGAIVGGLLLLLVGVAIHRWMLRKSRREKKHLLDYKSIAESCGIVGFHPLKTKEQKDEGWKACAEKMANVQSGELRLALFTGASTFSYESKKANHLSLLREALLLHRGDLRILLMRKGCREWDRCISEFGNGANPDSYRKELDDGYENALDFCRYLAKKKPHELKSIEVRLYDRPPLWKMVIMGDALIWLQHYIPRAHVDDRPAYIVNCAVAGGMGHPLENVFEYRWETSKDNVVIHRNEKGDRIDNSVPHTP